jgi:hypothetical protein
MRKNKNDISKLAGEMAFVAAITLLNRCMEKKEHVMVHRNGDEKQLKRNLNLVNLIYHAIGIFYNE